MKTILVDAVYTFVSDSGEIDEGLHALLEKFPNKKILLTGADDEQFKKWKLDTVPYQVFTLKHNPEKQDPEYYRKMLGRFGLDKNEVVYFEHDEGAAESARSVGIKTYHYDSDKRDLAGLTQFLSENL
jgi:FMN phosphatase YigB (HAD superfamily)